MASKSKLLDRNIQSNSPRAILVVGRNGIAAGVFVDGLSAPEPVEGAFFRGSLHSLEHAEHRVDFTGCTGWLLVELSAVVGGHCALDQTGLGHVLATRALLQAIDRTVYSTTRILLLSNKKKIIHNQVQH